MSEMKNLAKLEAPPHNTAMAINFPTLERLVIRLK